MEQQRAGALLYLRREQSSFCSLQLCCKRLPDRPAARLSTAERHRGTRQAALPDPQSLRGRLHRKALPRRDASSACKNATHQHRRKLAGSYAEKIKRLSGFTSLQNLSRLPQDIARSASTCRRPTRRRPKHALSVLPKTCLCRTGEIIRKTDRRSVCFPCQDTQLSPFIPSPSFNSK